MHFKVEKYINYEAFFSCGKHELNFDSTCQNSVVSRSEIEAPCCMLEHSILVSLFPV